MTWKIAPAIAAEIRLLQNPLKSPPTQHIYLVKFVSKLISKGVINIVHGKGKPQERRLLNNVMLFLLLAEQKLEKLLLKKLRVNLKNVH